LSAEQRHIVNKLAYKAQRRTYIRTE